MVVVVFFFNIKIKIPALSHFENRIEILEIGQASNDEICRTNMNYLRDMCAG